MKFFYFLALLLIGSTLSAQNYDSRIAETRINLSEVERVEMPAQDNNSLLQKELERRGPGIAPKFATPFEVAFNPLTHGNWETLSNDLAVWRLRISSETAYSLNLGFSEFFLPHGAKLIFYSEDKKYVWGPFTPADNDEHEQFWTPVFKGDKLVVELQLPKEQKPHLKLKINWVNHDFVDFNSVASGSCNLDVICSEADGWGIVDKYRDIIQSVAVISTGGVTFCTGFLVNSTRNDCTPYFMTANHCLGAGQAPSLVAYWNFNNSTCREPNSPQSESPGDGQLTDYNTGAIYRSSYQPSDFYLAELDDPVSETADAFFAGWNITPHAPVDTMISVHHPNTDEKRISFDWEEGFVADYFGSPDPNGNHIMVPDWDVGTTEGGSSGSPLFDRKKRVVGQLHGGGAACGNDEPDYYGWMYISWEGGGNPDSRLKDWLDPDETGIELLDGRSQLSCSFFAEASDPHQELCAPDSAFYSIVVSENFSGEVSLGLENIPDSLMTAFSSNPVNPGDTVALVLFNTANVVSGNHVLNLIAMDSVDSSTSEISLNIFSGIPQTPIAIFPTDGAGGLTTQVQLQWGAMGSPQHFQIQLATDPEFTNIIQSETGLTAVSFVSQTLDELTTYFWRVAASNICGETEWSNAYSFTTGAVLCKVAGASDVPVEISEELETTISSTIEIDQVGLVTAVSLLNFDVSHTWVGDLDATLTSPSGTMIKVFNRPGISTSNYGCDGDNLLLSFDDSAMQTASDFQESCGENPAIEGAFQPAESFQAFIGESANGTWTLSIKDHFDQDGGALNSWQLNICTALPDVAEVIPFVDQLDFCASENQSFELFVGTGFENDEVMLSAENLPEGAVVEFSQNPVAPGSFVEVNLSLFAEPGTYQIQFDATDGQTDSQFFIDLNVEGAPGELSLLSPVHQSTGLEGAIQLEWQLAEDIESYTLYLATDSLFTELILAQTTTDTFLTFINPVQGTDYFWMVEAQNPCGMATSEIWQFSSLPDLSITLTPDAMSICQTEDAEFLILVPEGYNTPVGISSSMDGTAGVVVTYNVDPADIPPGTEVIATVSGLFNLGIGTYNVEFVVSDDIHTNTAAAAMTLLAAPEVPTLSLPENGAMIEETMPLLEWDAVAGANYYMLEIAADANFEDIVLTDNVATNQLEITDALPLGLYYWRITSVNDCGNGTAAAFNFTVIPPVAVDELNGVRFQIDPNPTTGRLNIRISEPLQGGIKAELYAINGQRLQNINFDARDLNIQLDLSPYSDGTYLLRLTNNRVSIHQKIVLTR